MLLTCHISLQMLHAPYLRHRLGEESRTNNNVSKDGTTRPKSTRPESTTYIQRIIEPQAPINRLDGLHILILQIEPQHVQILRQPIWIVALRDHGHIPLRRPPQQHLRGRLAMLVRDLLDVRMLQQQGGVLGLLHVHFEETLRAKGTVRRDGDAFVLRVLDEPFLHQVGVMFDLQGRGPDLGVAEEIHQQDAAEVTDADTPAQTPLDEFLHRGPRFLDTRLTGRDVVVFVREAGWIADFGVDVLEGDREMHDVEVEVVEAPVFELLFADGFDAGAVVEGVPDFGDEEEVGAFDETVFDGAGDALAGLDFVAVVWGQAG